MVYVCEMCGVEHKCAVDALKCEANHLGLTIEEYQEYTALLRKEKECGINVSITKNERTERLLEEAINAVIKFQKEHNITDNR